MSNLTRTDFQEEDGARAVEESEQGLLTSAAADTVLRLTILARLLVAAGAIAADGGNTGNGTITLFTIVAGDVPKVGTYQFILTAALIGKLVDPDGDDIASDIALNDGTTTVISAGGLQFTITDGGTAFVATDFFTIIVGAGTGNYAFFAPAGAGGVQLPKVVSLSEVVAAGAGDDPVGVMLKGKIREDRLIIDGSAAGVGITDAIKDQLRDYGIIVEPATETAALDNA
jgi:hypothetical protein